MVSEAVYRFEHAKTGRAKCRNKACIDNIQKGELRMGTLVTIQDHTSWHWKHWGCVTPLQIANLQGQIEGLDVDNDNDMEVIDGFEDLDEEAREKVREALKVGHVADEDWKGDPELNRPGMKGINKRTPKKKAASEEAAEATEASEPETPAKKPKAKAKKAVKDEADVDDEIKPAKSTKKRKVDASSEVEAEPKTLPKKPKKSKGAVKQEDSEVEDVKPAKKATKARAKKPAPVAEEQAAAANGFVDGAAGEVDGDRAAKAKKSKKSKAKAEVKAEDAEVEMEDVAPAVNKRASGRKTRTRA